MNQTISRRSFITKATLAASAMAVLPKFAIGKSGGSANDKLNVAVIGVARMGSMCVGAAATQNIIAFADVDDETAAPTYKKHPKTPRYKDFRVMLEKHQHEIDVVLISTPDHTHFPAAMAAMELGKHVFVQKPLTHDIWQARTLQKAAKYYNVQTNMGNQGRCSDGIRSIKEWYDSGLIGEVEELHAWTIRPFQKWRIPLGKELPPKQPVRAGLDWNLWQGPVLERDYNECYLPRNWRGWWDYGNSAMGDIGCHLLDSVYWALNLTGPVSVKSEADEYHDQLTPLKGIIRFNYPRRGKHAPVQVNWYEGGLKPNIPIGWDFGDYFESEGILIKGSKHTIYHGDIRPNSPMIVMKRDEWVEFRKTSLPPKTIPRVKHSFGPVGELYAAIKGGPKPGSHFDYAAPLTELCSLGAIARRTGKQLDFDSKTMSFKDTSLNRYIKNPVRKGWNYGDNLWT